MTSLSSRDGRPMQPSCQRGTKAKIECPDDLILVDELTKTTVLDIVKKRFSSREIHVSFMAVNSS